jgi:hypothetical protein
VLDAEFFFFFFFSKISLKQGHSKYCSPKIFFARALIKPRGDFQAFLWIHWIRLMMNPEQAEEIKRQALRCWRSTLPKLKTKKKKKVHSLSNGKVKDAL